MMKIMFFEDDKKLYEGDKNNEGDKYNEGDKKLCG